MIRYAAIILAGCMVISEGAPSTEDLLTAPAATFDAWCELLPELDCGHVFMFDTAADNPLGKVEMCISAKDEADHLWLAELEYGASFPTSRHPGPCIHCCGEGCGKGCNAYGDANRKNACFCPEE